MMLGNLSLGEMQARAGVDFPKELVDYMEPRRQQKAEKIGTGEWHCFDFPFTLLCGDQETAKEIFDHLKPLSKQFKESLKIAIGS